MTKPLPLDEHSTFYEILEIGSDSSPQEIREAYLRLKAAYNKDSPALYSLMSRDETEQTLQDIESAYVVLSNPERRKEYDHKHGFIDDTDPFLSGTPKHLHKLHSRNHMISPESEKSARKSKKTESRPEAESEELFGSSEGLHEEILDAPVTDFTHARMPSERNTVKFSTGAQAPQKPPVNEDSKTSAEIEEDSELEGLIQKELEWRGQFIKKIREARHLSIEELADYTKISKKYLKAIEEEDYPKLPAPVYLRGFVIQLAKRLKIPSETVAAAYLARYLQACSNAENQAN